MDATQAYGVGAFLSQTDVVGKIVLIAMMLMSMTTWYLIISKTLQGIFLRRSVKQFLDRFWAAASIEEAAAAIDDKEPGDPFAMLTIRALRAREHHALHGVQRLDEAGSLQDFLMRAMRSAIADQNLRAESGMTLLASVGATAPFVGLFGTVWGVYKALISIGMTGQGTLDKVAGPVGEALIMTAIGLAVAIPAVLAYNTFNRQSRLLGARLDAFAHDLFSLLTTGAQLKSRSS